MVLMSNSSTETTTDQQQIISTYLEEIVGSGFSVKKIMKLELSQYLEQKLWPTYCQYQQQQIENINKDDTEFKKSLLMSIVVMINEKFRERATVWDCFQLQPQCFPSFFSSITELILQSKHKSEPEGKSLTLKEKIPLLIFLIHCFNSVEIELVRKEIQKYISLPIWCCLSSSRLRREFEKVPKFKKFWNKLEKQDQKLSSERRSEVETERRFLFHLIHDYFHILASIPAYSTSTSSSSSRCSNNYNHRESIHYCERFMEFLIDLEALLPTRRFFNALLDDLHVLTISRYVLVLFWF